MTDNSLNGLFRDYIHIKAESLFIAQGVSPGLGVFSPPI